jgi:hypothetical protein
LAYIGYAEGDERYSLIHLRSLPRAMT